MLKALLFIARWIGLAHDRWRARVCRRRPLVAEVDALREHLEKLRAENELLRSRMREVDSRRRPHYASWQRLAILIHQARYGLSIEATARTFVLSIQTVLNWKKEVVSGVARLVQARPPVNRLPELVDQIVRQLKHEWPRWGTRRIAGILARLGIEASRTSVQRILRRRRPPRKARRIALIHRGKLVAKFPGHIYLTDFTRLKSFFRSVVVGAVIDAYSRKVLAIRVSPSEPDAAFAVNLQREAINRHGKPRWIISDHGAQFTAARFAGYLRRRKIRRRFGAVGRSNSIATIERFWRSMKSEFARGLFLYRPIRAIERQLESYCAWFNAERPHWGLGLRTPDEAHFGKTPRSKRRLESGVLTVRLMAGERSLPVLRLRRAG
ncbi:MAG: IS3 family transposase [Planctomycetes bacterium]|nr:IS3 family transposase [Planctomycetota bacterium]